MNTKQIQYQRYGNFIINKFQPLGSGNYGRVWKGYLITTKNTLQPVAIKQSYNETQNIKEIQTLQILKHPHIIRYRDYRIYGNLVFMVMQLCQNGTLDDLMFKNQIHDHNKIVQTYSQIVSGIKFMYQKKVLHRDLKPSNILVDGKGGIKIADFGTSKIHKSSQMKLRTLVGTPLFFSPELLEMSLGEEDTYTEKSQIWALGLILYFMFNYEYSNMKADERIKESLPWNGRNKTEILKNIKEQPLAFKKKERISKDIKQILVKMLKINVQERMSFQQLFELQIFQPKNQSPLNQSQPQSPPEHQFQEERTINQIKKQTIDEQLLDLLERKDQPNENEDEVKQYCELYELLIEQLGSIEPKYQDLLFELQLQLYHISNNQSQKQKIKQKYRDKNAKLFELEQSIKKATNENLSSSNFLMPKKQFEIGFSLTESINETYNIHLCLPRQNLVNQSKKFLKQNIHQVLDFKFSGNHRKLAIGSTQEKLVRMAYFVYDLYILITLQKSWEIKRKSKATILGYRKLRAAVSIETIINRIKNASDVIAL